MTGIQIVNSIATSLYEFLILCGIAGFAVYDLETRRVPDKALALFCLAALPAPFVHAWPFTGWLIWFLYLLSSAMGAAIGFLILLSASLCSEDAKGIGGGDIKLAAIMGFIYGPTQMIVLLLTASALSVLAVFLFYRKHLKEPISLPFVPFLAMGSLLITMNTFIR